MSLDEIKQSYAPLVNGIRVHLGDGKPMDAASVRDTILRHAPRRPGQRTVIDMAGQGLGSARQTPSAGQSAPKSAAAEAGSNRAPWYLRAKRETARKSFPSPNLSRKLRLGEP
ncbi:hypothetical protein LO772_33265 [Yinghuangia sp. ASG 101]|uniref:hypothetical protein n=1 Tax=Yinghuangia sp. ASG 101 TaxID=2896848 RepID=UPI001E42EACA|nr:hypothetical protein [Yinghuangia sp. ASG 101]UGQ11590.1 hypothetical protein LO772_33265 [Yinghuangia sp. ASG 101]